MSIRENQRDAVVERLAAHLLEHGLARASLRQLAEAAAVSDRMLMYYFRDKTEILAESVSHVAQGLARMLDAAIPSDARLSAGVLARQAADITTRAETRPYMRLWIEIVAAAARREEPFVAIAGQIMSGFRQWIEPRLDLPPGEKRQAAALSVIAICDGLALIDICAGEAAAHQARLALPLSPE